MVFAPWYRLRHLRAVAVLLLLASSACGPIGPWTTAQAPPPATPPASAPGAPTTAAPVWQPGDRWVFEWTAGNSKGVKAVTVLETHEIAGVPYYVVRIGDVEHYYTIEIHWAFAVRASKVEARMVPPTPWFVWPLNVGDRWHHRGGFEDRSGRGLNVDTFRVVTVELVEVPAGRFQALKIVREGQDGETDEYWYAPEVRWYVRWVARRGELSFEERLQSYDPAPRPS